jgi:TRAP-type C4-dicarboxylate transport system substrate-binding protein
VNIPTRVSHRLVVGAVMAVAALSCSAALAQSTVTLKFANFVGPTSALTVKIFQPWFKQIEDDAGGALKIEFLSGGAAAKPNEVIDAVRAGVVDIGWSATSYNPGRFNAAGVTELPSLMHSPAEGAAGLAEVYERGLLDGFDGVKLLGVFTSDVSLLHHAGDAKGLADFKGAKVRAAGAVVSSMIEKVGASPVAVPITSLAEGLAKKVVDGAAADWFSMEGFRLIDVTRTHVNLAVGAAGMYLVINKAKYDQLPPKAKAALDKYSVRDFAMFWGTRLEKESNRVRQVVANSAGHKVIEPTAEDTATWAAASRDVIDAWAKRTKDGPAVLEAFQKGVKSRASSAK